MLPNIADNGLTVARGLRWATNSRSCAGLAQGEGSLDGCRRRGTGRWKKTGLFAAERLVETGCPSADGSRDPVSLRRRRNAPRVALAGPADRGAAVLRWR